MPAVLLTAGRLIARHWPALLALSLLGAGIRAGVLWAAVEVSDSVPILGQLILILAPLGYLLPIIAMLHLCGASLPRLKEVSAQRAPEAVTEGRERRLVDVAVSVLVPFLAVYVSYGLLDQDISRFRNEAAFNEFNRFSLLHTLHYDYAGRLGIYPVQIALMIVAIAWVLRWTLGRIENLTRFLLLAFLGALVEVYYTGQVAGQSVQVRTAGTNWLDDRVAVHTVRSTYERVVDHLGWFGHPVDALTTWVLGLVGSLDAVVVVPIAWLAVGAVVLGHKLAPPAPFEHPWIERLTVVPAWLRKGLASLLSDIVERFSAFWNGLRLLGSAGLLPMLVFGLAFLVAIRIPLLFSEAVRLLIGPLDTDTWLAISPMEAGLGLALSMAVTAPLLAAALEWVLVPSLLSEAAAGSRSPAERTTP
ncbi:hypothetical protein D9V37_04215 [Nocardioides mangrovicus]|uniref:Uncharacterized protein n=1 Tax=Nocardioides mangrovicus TaxID=2478913 RepID=A0A3L8P6S7_9ACTN|nr:hypothetical protein D9V37_04215 [Nocardioides mangrovicus]